MRPCTLHTKSLLIRLPNTWRHKQHSKCSNKPFTVWREHAAELFLNKRCHVRAITSLRKLYPIRRAYKLYALRGCRSIRTERTCSVAVDWRGPHAEKREKKNSDPWALLVRHKEVLREGGRDSHELGTSWRLSGQLHAPIAILRGKCHGYTSDRRHGGPLGPA